ncbi:unnamed protein product, partial [Trichobilharzia regenti]
MYALLGRGSNMSLVSERKAEGWVLRGRDEGSIWHSIFLIQRAEQDLILGWVFYSESDLSGDIEDKRKESELPYMHMERELGIHGTPRLYVVPSHSLPHKRITGVQSHTLEQSTVTVNSPEPEDNDFQTELRSLQYISRENNVVNDEASENNESGGHLVVPQSTNESTQLQRFQTNNPRPFGILEVDRSSKHKSLSKKNFKSNQEAYDKMLDAVRELGSFVVQRQNAPSSSGDHSRTLEEMKFRFSKRVRSKSTTYDDPISHGLSPSSKTKHLPKSTRRTTSLTKRSKSP